MKNCSCAVACASGLCASLGRRVRAENLATLFTFFGKQIVPASSKLQSIWIILLNSTLYDSIRAMRALCELYKSAVVSSLRGASSARAAPVTQCQLRRGHGKPATTSRGCRRPPRFQCAGRLLATCNAPLPARPSAVAKDATRVLRDGQDPFKTKKGAD